MAITLASAIPLGTDVEQLGSDASGGVVVGAAAADKVAFYGTTAVSQRKAAAQDTTALSTASSTAIDTQTKAALIEIMDTLRVLGIWKGSA